MAALLMRFMSVSAVLSSDAVVFVLGIDCGGIDNCLAIC